MDGDTVAALVTPPGAGGLGVVRLSGPEALATADRLFRAASPLKESPSHTLHHGVVHRDGAPLDDAVAAVFRAPRSYTGEDVVELSCHGNAELVRGVLALCCEKGARPAGPGEFTRRAFLNGKMDLAQAEAVALLVSARSEAARRWALEQLRGGLSSFLGKIRGDLLSLLARLEAALDFAEEEVPDLPRPELARRTEEASAALAALLATAPRGRAYRDGARAVLAGRPNVGKSSLFNALLGRDRAIVTDAPGTTRDVLEESLSADGLPVLLTDTAGLRDGPDPAEAEGVSRAKRSIERADAALWVVDAADPFTPADREARRALDAAPRVITVLNKADRLPDARDRMTLLEKAGPGSILVSALTGEGLPDLARALARACLPEGAAARETGESPVLLGDRHEALAREAAQALGNALRAARDGDPDECVALELRGALDALDRVTGRKTSDEVLDEIFARFCVGK